MKVIHIADVHWRGLTRHDEYKKAFSDLFEQARDLNPDCFVIAGDIVHSKTQGISPELIDCLNWWFTEMNRIATVHVMLGNHDGLVLNKDRQDAISPILRALNLSRTYLYRDSGIYPDPNNSEYNWCVFSPFDVEKWGKVVPSAGINIALFHGALWGSHTDSNWMIQGEERLAFFRKFDFTMLGDIHKCQAMDAERRVWYCGSTIQQNYGESGEKGFLFWDIESKDKWTVDFFPVKHDNPFVSFEWQGTVLETIEKSKQYKDGTRFRILSDRQIDPKDQRKLSNTLRREKKALEVVYKLGTTTNSSISEETSVIKVEDLSNPIVHKTLLREYHSKTEEPIGFWNEVDRIVDEIVPKISVSTPRGNKWSLRNLGFDNTFGFGEGNSINFQSLNGIIGLFGKNRSGKSSIPGSLMYGMFNTNDRGISSLLHVINTRKPYCAADITFSVNSRLYRLERQTVKHKVKNRAETTITHLNLYEVDETGCILKDLSGEQRKDTEQSLKALVGTPDEFMITSFAAQGNMNAFISKGATDRKRVISRFLGLDVFDLFHTAVKEEAAGIKALIKRLDAKDWTKEIRDHKIAIDLLEERRAELQVSQMTLKQKLSTLQKRAELAHGDDFIDPAEILSKEESLLIKKQQFEKSELKLLGIKEQIKSINKKFKKYDLIKSQFPIDGLRRKAESTDQLNKGLAKLQLEFNNQKNTLDRQTESLKRLAEVPCGDTFPSCKFIKNSHDNKRLIFNQGEIVSGLHKEVINMKSSLKELEDEGIKNKIQKYESMLKKETADRIALVTLESEITQIRHQKTLLTTNINLLEDKLSEMRLKVSENASDELEKIRLEIGKLNFGLLEIDSERLTVSEEIGTLQSKVQSFKSERENFEKLQVEWKVYDFLIKATSWRGIPTYIIGRKLPAVNLELSEILQDITGFTIELEVDERSTNIYLNYGDSRRPIECASGMEKMVSSLALRVALANISSLNKSDILLIDEGFGTLDPQNIEAVVRLLQRLKKWYRQIIIISHIDVIKDAVDEMIIINKDGKDSRVIHV